MGTVAEIPKVLRVVDHASEALHAIEIGEYASIIVNSIISTRRATLGNLPALPTLRYSAPNNFCNKKPMRGIEHRKQHDAPLRKQPFKPDVHSGASGREDHVRKNG